MPRNGSGSYTATANSVNPAVAATTIDASDFNDVLDDLETALTESIARDGQTTTTAAIPFASGIKADTIAENSSNTGVTVDGVLLKDTNITVLDQVIFEGATADAYETTLTVTDPTADRTATIPNATGTFMFNVSEDTTPQLGGPLDTNNLAINESKGTSVASATTTNIWVTDGNTPHISGTTTITSFGTAPRVGAWRKVIFDAALTLTDGSNLNLPGGANITTATDDFAFVFAETTTLFKVLYFKVDGTAVVVGAAGPSQATQSAIEAETNENTYIPPDLNKHSPGVAKAWANLTGTGTIELKDNYNIISITDNGTGDYTFTIDTDFSDAGYAYVFGAHSEGVKGANFIAVINANTPTAGVLRVQAYAHDGSVIDPNAVNFAAFGDQ